MLGLADRGLVFDLMDAVMSGQPRRPLQITELAYERGADLGMMLQDLLELTTRSPGSSRCLRYATAHDLPEAERTRGAAIADRLSVPVLGRAWQMLLKGVGEVEAAPDRRAAAEMVLIRLCHVSDMPLAGRSGPPARRWWHACRQRSRRSRAVWRRGACRGWWGACGGGNPTNSGRPATGQLP